jgi:hypothetical protein
MSLFSKSRCALVLGALLVTWTATISGQVVAPADQSGSQTSGQVGTKKKPPSAKSCALPGIPAQRIQDVVDATGVLPPSLSADAMIRVASKVASACPALAKDLLQRAFDQAETIELPIAYKVATGMGYSTDSRFAFMDRTYALAMDQLSLRSRAVLGMAPIDGDKAIQLFQQIAPPSAPAATCASGFAPDVSIYYDALGKILALWKARKPRNDAEAQAPLQRLEEVTSATSSPVQLAPLVKVFEDANLPPSQLSSLVNTLTAAVGNFPADDDSFYYRHKYPSLKARDELAQLAATKQISAAAFLHSFLDYLNRSLNGPHCDGNEPKDLKELGILYRSFTHLPGTPEQQVETLSLPDSLPPVEPSPGAGEYWQSLKGKQLLLDAKHLNFDDNWKPYTDADRKTPEWEDRVRHLLDDMDSWNVSDEASPVDYYHERSILTFRLLAQIRPGNLYDRVLEEWIKTFTESSLQFDNPPEWYISVAEFLQYSRKDSKIPIPAAATDVLKNSSNPNLSSLGVIAEFLQ